MKSVTISDSTYPKILSGTQSVVVPPIGSSEYLDISTDSTDILTFNLFVRIDSDKYLFPIPFYQVASNPAGWVSVTNNMQVQCYALLPGSMNPSTGLTVSTYTLSVFFLNLDSTTHTLHIDYFIYNERVVPI